MELLLERDRRTNITTIGKLYVNGQFQCFILEDKDRGLSSDMKLEDIKKIKVPGKTAIPSGRYKVIINKSVRFGVDMPLLLKVPGYDGVRMHPGNTAENTEGCLLPGTVRVVDKVINSRLAYGALFDAMKAADVRDEDIFITIK